MATYLELSSIQDDPQYNDLLSKIRVACAIKAAAIIGSPTPGATALDWARATVSNPNAAGAAIISYVIAVNAGATTAQIYSASDAAIQSNVNDAVDAIYGA